MQQLDFDSSLDIAIIGMACRFPGASNPDEFWANLVSGVEAIRVFTDDELLANGVPESMIRDPAYVKATGYLPNSDLFDSGFFGFNPKEANFTDPQHRVFLECAWEALENAGYGSEQYRGVTGVYAGCGMNTYLLFNVSRFFSESDISASQVSIGNDKDYLASRVSYKLNLTGPSLTLQTACSTSLVCVHQASQALLNGECDLALAGGVTIRSNQNVGYIYQEGGILSADGHCRAFDYLATGTVAGNGAGLVVLKRLEDALADHDNIVALIKGSAVNNDGSHKVGYAAPGIDGQAGVIRAAQKAANISSDTITYVEAHGTGTKLGDPIEIIALTQAFNRDTTKVGYCMIGSVKSNIGHLDTASGVAGLIKAALALQHKQIPATLHFQQPNANIDFSTTPFRVNAELCDWPKMIHPRRAGVSSFGIGGTNAHVIVEEAPARSETSETNGTSHPYQLLTLSARSPSALSRCSRRLAEHLERTRDISLADTAFTLKLGRSEFAYRAMLVCRDKEEAIASLSAEPIAMHPNRMKVPTDTRVIFMFSGQGAQHKDMGQSLYEADPVFRSAMERCDHILSSFAGVSILDAVYPELRAVANPPPINRTDVTQPLLFALEYSLASLYLSWGIRPDALIGHSIGELVAACLAGVFTLNDALSLTVERGRLMNIQPPGTMLSVSATEAAISSYLVGGLAVAAVNTNRHCVISGPSDEVNELHERLEQQNYACRLLHTSHAFHSSMMDAVVEPLMAYVGKLILKPPTIPLISGTTGTWITPDEATSPAYWANQLRQKIRFYDGLRQVAAEFPESFYLELGPGRTLSTFAKQILPGEREQLIKNSLPHPDDKHNDQEVILNALGALWLAGVSIDWLAFYSGQVRHRVPLPTYSFEWQRHWLDIPKTGTVDPGVISHDRPGLSDENASSDNGSLPDTRTGQTDTDQYIDGNRQVHDGGDLGNAENDGEDLGNAEDVIKTIWSQLLGIQRIGRNDDFFELGGHSLLATQILARLRTAFGVTLPISSLYEARTVATLAEVVEFAVIEMIMDQSDHSISKYNTNDDE